MRIMAFKGLFLLSALAFLLLVRFQPAAQTQDDNPRATIISGAELEDMLMQEGGDNPLRVFNAPDAHYGIFVLSREPRAAQGPANGAYHSAIGEIYFVASGTGTFIIGQGLENPTPVDSDSQQYSRAGPGANGRILQPQMVKYNPGTIFIIPPGVPHNATYEVDTAVDFIVYRFDPGKTLPLH